jgi:hypothetical protein
LRGVSKVWAADTGACGHPERLAEYGEPLRMTAECVGSLWFVASP